MNHTFQIVLFAACVAVVCASPLMWDVTDWPHHPGCNYNITADTNLQPQKGAGGVWYFDSVTASGKLTTTTCLRVSGRFRVKNGRVGWLDYQIKGRDGSSPPDLINCTGPNYADAISDFNERCRWVSRESSPYDEQWRIAETDNKKYALVTICLGRHTDAHYLEAVGLLSRSKSGLSASTRRRLIERLVKAGWNRAMIYRVPSQSGC